MILFRVKVPQVAGMTSSAWRRVLPRFQKEAGERLVNAVRDVLGRDDLYALSETYKKAKPRLKRYKHVAGKSAWQPLILSGAMWEAVTWAKEGDTVVAYVEDTAASGGDGFDYVEEWEDKTHFLELALDEVEDELPQLLLDLIFEEMGL